MLKYHINDLVSVNPNLSGWPTGTEAIIATIDHADCSLPYRIKRLENGDCIWCSEKQLTLVKRTHVFKVGDKVRVIDHRPANANEFPTWNDSMDRYAGKTGTVKWTDDNGYISVQFDDDWWVYRPEWLIPLKSTVGIIDAIRDNPIKDKLPLLSNNQLLTNIKLD